MNSFRDFVLVRKFYNGRILSSDIAVFEISTDLNNFYLEAIWGNFLMIVSEKALPDNFRDLKVMLPWAISNKSLFAEKLEISSATNVKLSIEMWDESPSSKMSS